MTDVLDIECPECGAKPGSPCVYLKPKRGRSDVVAWERTGQPTIRPHRGRFRRLTDLSIKS